MTEQQITEIRFECIKIVRSLKTMTVTKKNLIETAETLERFVTFSNDIPNITYRLECARIASTYAQNIRELIHEATRINNYLGSNTANLKTN